MKLLITIDHPNIIPEKNIKRFITSVLKLEAMRGDFKVSVEDYNGRTAIINEQEGNSKIQMAGD